MPTKTDRILSYLPGTFNTLPQPPAPFKRTALYTIADAFGNELLHAENSLAAVMLAHWVNHADRGQDLITDLACIAALYGLQPRNAEVVPTVFGDLTGCQSLTSDESVEEFREHLLRYVRTFLEGTVTVQGILRIVAEALGLHIADAYADLDTWWTRPGDMLETTGPRGDDASSLVLGLEQATATGHAAEAAHVTGNIDLGAGVDTSRAPILRLKVNAAAPVDVDLTPAGTLPKIVSAINDRVGAPVASDDGHFLTLTSPTLGSNSRLEVQENDRDAAPQLLGLLPRTYRGSAAIAAHVTGTVDLSSGVDLHDVRYIRLTVDRTRLAEVDCASRAANVAATKLDEIVLAINQALGAPVASHDGHFLTLTSPTVGFAGSILFEAPAAQEATERIFGPVVTFYAGRDARPGQVTGTHDLSRGVDLSTRAQVSVRLDGGQAVTVNCAGPDPANTRIGEIVAAFNTTLRGNFASHDGHYVRLASPTVGPNGTVAFTPVPPGQDATEIIFSIRPRAYQGIAAAPARLVGAVDLSANPLPDLAAVHIINMALDGGEPVQVDVRAVAHDWRAVAVDEIVQAINAKLGAGIASSDGQHLILTSPTSGGVSSISITPLEIRRRRRFVTRALLTDEAAQTVFGFITRRAQGSPATSACIAGSIDLSRGIDLRDARFMRIGLDGAPPVEVDFAAVPTLLARPRVARLDDIVNAINARFPAGIASHDEQHLILASPSTGESSRLTFESPRSADALATLLGIEPGTIRGKPATGVHFVGTVDLSAGKDLPANAAIALGIDGAAPVDIPLAEQAAAHKSFSEIVNTINVKFDSVIARFEDNYISLTSSNGAGGRIDFAVPSSGQDVTETIFGIRGPRSYHGADESAALVEGQPDLHDVDLHTARYLRLAVDGQPPVDVDCASRAADPAHVTLANIKDAINGKPGAPTARDDGTHLILASQNTGPSARIDLLPYTAGDARAKLLGNVSDVVQGTDPANAVITGEADLLAPVNLAGQSTLRFAIDGERPVLVDVAGAAPDSTTLAEIVAKINARMPGVASATDDDHLRLTSRTAGEDSRLELLPVQTLELIEYPEEPAQDPPPVKNGDQWTEPPPRALRHGDLWSVVNGGAANADLSIELTAPQGTAGPMFVNRTTHQRIRLMTALRRGEQVVIERTANAEIGARITASDGTQRTVPPAQILAGPQGPQVLVPFEDEWQLGGGDGGNAATLGLNDPLAPSLVVLSARQVQGPVTVRVTEAQLVYTSGGPVQTPGQSSRLVGRVGGNAPNYNLVGASAAVLASLRPGPGVDFGQYLNRVVSVHGRLYPEESAPPVMLVERIANLFDVTLSAGDLQDGPYNAVTIGQGWDAEHSLSFQVNTRGSKVAFAKELEKAAALALPVGRSDWIYMDCYGSRFNRDRFDEAKFAGGRCDERAVFDISRFTHVPPEQQAAVFAMPGPLSDPPVEVRFRWGQCQPGRFVVNLPVNLPANFGGRFDRARFGQATDKPMEYLEVVTEPLGDPDHLVTKINQDSGRLVEASVVGRAPLGFTPVTMPFRTPRTRTLVGGKEGQAAQLYIQDVEVPVIVKLEARIPGAGGNNIAVTVRPAGPARFDVTISYQGARFESARQVALAGRNLKPDEPPLAALSQDLFKPGPVGVLLAKAAGIHAAVTRDGAYSVD